MNGGKIKTYTIKRVTGAHLPTPLLFGPANRPGDIADYCLGTVWLVYGNRFVGYEIITAWLVCGNDGLVGMW